MILLGTLILYVLMLTMLEQLSSHRVIAAAAAAAPPSRSELLKFESLSDSTSSLNSLLSTSRNTFYTSKWGSTVGQNKLNSASRSLQGPLLFMQLFWS